MPTLEASNLDGRGFIEGLAAQRLPVDHVIMNLPDSALEFLGMSLPLQCYSGEEGSTTLGSS